MKHPVTVAEIGGRFWAGVAVKIPSAGGVFDTVENRFISITSTAEEIGVGAAADQIRRAREIGHHTILAIIDADQAGASGCMSGLGLPARRISTTGVQIHRWLDVV